MGMLSTADTSEIVRRYQSGESGTDLAAIYGVTFSTIYRKLEKSGLSRRGLSEAKRTLKFDELAFDTLTPNAKYWIGFLFADGTILNDGPNQSNKIKLGVSDEDESHVHKLKHFLKSDHKISKYTKASNGYSYCELSIRSDHMTSRLKELGLCGKLQHVAHESLEADPDFWRGVVDGDGHLRITRCGYQMREHAALEVCGGKQLLEQFHRLVQAVHPKYQGNITKHSSIWRVKLTGSSAVSMVRFLYDNPSTSLDRKYEAAKEIMHRFSHY